jgi:hypothetical protein
VQTLAQTLTTARFDAPVRDNIRWNVWLKLWGNACYNPIRLLTLATLDRITSEPGLRSVCVAVMRECRRVAQALQIDIPESMIERRLNVAGSAAGHKMSMLQDLERGRSLELEALVAAVQELGRLTATPTPALDVLLALAQERGRQASLSIHRRRSVVPRFRARRTSGPRRLPPRQATPRVAMTRDQKVMRLYAGIGYLMARNERGREPMRSVRPLNWGKWWDGWDSN